MGEDPKADPEVSKWMGNIAGKVTVVKDLEKRLDIMQGLDPLMDGILEKMNEVTDHSNLRKIQAIDNLKKANAKLEDTILRGYASGMVVHEPLVFDSPKESAIKNVVRNTMRKIED